MTFLWITPALAIPPEGLEAFSFGGQGKAAPAFLYVQGGYVNPSWETDYETLQSYMSFPTQSGNYWTLGGEVTAGNTFGDRDIYFARYDQVFWGQSISLKFTHEDLRYVQAGKNIFSLEYNAGFSIGSAAGFYFSAGAYYRFNLNSWNTPAWSPVNWNTDDRDSFLEVCVGSRIVISQNSYFTVDINNRDPFLTYNGDDFALDFTLNLVSSDQLTWRLTESTRFSGLLVGTADISEEKVLFGFVTSF